MQNLKEKLNKKLGKNGGFTLVEMLIVVAIIAILIAVSVPMMSSSLDEAKKATDRANQRSAIGLATAQYMLQKESGTVKYVYNIGTGGTGSVEKHTGTGDPTSSSKYGQCNDHKNGYIVVTVPESGDATCEWMGCSKTAADD